MGRGNLFRSFHWQLVNFCSQHFQFIFAVPQPSNFPSPIELFTLLPPVTICNTHRGWRTTGLVQFSVLVMVTPCPVDWLSVGRSACPSVRPSVTHSIETRRGEWPVTSSSCACPKDFQSNLSNITTFNQTQKALQLIFLSSTLSNDDDDEDDETTLQDTHVTTNELTMDTATQSKREAGGRGQVQLQLQLQHYGRINHSLWHPSIFHIFQFIFAIYSNTSAA